MTLHRAGSIYTCMHSRISHNIIILPSQGQHLADDSGLLQLVPEAGISPAERINKKLLATCTCHVIHDYKMF